MRCTDLRVLPGTAERKDEKLLWINLATIIKWHKRNMTDACFLVILVTEMIQSYFN